MQRETMNGANGGNGNGGSREDYSFSGSHYLLNLCMKEANQYKPLALQEEHELARRMQLGDREARNLIIQSSLYFVIRIARQFASYGLPVEDLIQEGSLGLLKAARSFRVSKNYRFLTYAAWWVRREMAQAVRAKTGVVSISGHTQSKIRRLRQAIRTLEATNGETPTDEEILKETGFSPEGFRDLSNTGKGPVYLDDPERTDDGFQATEYTSDGDITELVERRETHALVASWISTLKESEKTVITLRYGFGGDDPMTLEAIGSRIGITRERVRQIELKARMKIRRRARTEGYTWTDLLY